MPKNTDLAKSAENENFQTTRRSFLNILLGGGLLVLFGQALYPLIRYIIPPKIAEPTPTSVTGGKVSALLPNSGTIFRFGDKPGILIKTADGDIRAFSAICTHLQCTVRYDSNSQRIWCPCHNGYYDQHGINVAGPPPRPLEPYKVIVQGDNIVITKNSS